MVSTVSYPDTILAGSSMPQSGGDEAGTASGVGSGYHPSPDLPSIDVNIGYEHGWGC